MTITTTEDDDDDDEANGFGKVENPQENDGDRDDIYVFFSDDECRIVARE